MLDKLKEWLKNKLNKNWLWQRREKFFGLFRRLWKGFCDLLNRFCKNFCTLLRRLRVVLGVRIRSTKRLFRWLVKRWKKFVGECRFMIKEEPILGLLWLFLMLFAYLFFFSYICWICVNLFFFECFFE